MKIKQESKIILDLSYGEILDINDDLWRLADLNDDDWSIFSSGTRKFLQAYHTEFINSTEILFDED